MLCYIRFKLSRTYKENNNCADKLINYIFYCYILFGHNIYSIILWMGSYIIVCTFLVLDFASFFFLSGFEL